MHKRSMTGAALHPTEGGFVRLPSWLWALFALLALLALLTPNRLLTAISLLALPVLMQASWRVGEVPVLAFGLGWQWLQVTLQVFWADVQGANVSALSPFPAVEEATLLSLLGLVVLIMGVRFGLRIFRRRWQRRPGGPTVTGWNVSRLFALYLGAALVSSALQRLSGLAAGLRQPLGTLAEAHWVFFFLLLVGVIQSRRGYLLLVAAVGWEFVTGLGFWSGFKTPIFYLVLALLTVYSRPTFRGLAIGVGAAAALAFAGAVWMTVKGPYREFLNQGNGQQVVLVSPQQRIVTLSDLLGGWRLSDLPDGAERLVKRIEYVDYFAAVLNTVPNSVPFQHGRIWRRAIENLIPRLVWGGKPVLNDSDITRAYTGVMVAGAEEGTSIGIGYMAESYVDFGPVAMFIPILLLGVLWGVTYAYFMSRPHPAAVDYSFAAAALLDVVGFETSATKIVAGLVLRIVFLGLLVRYVMPRVEVWLAAGHNRARRLPVPSAVRAYGGWARHGRGAWWV